jgi:Protein tyrosine and serine/threonine kinase
VFAFGVLMFEGFTRGKEPWPLLSNAEAAAKVANGKRLAVPKEVADDAVTCELFGACFEELPEDRPSFETVSARLKSILSQVSEYAADKTDSHRSGSMTGGGAGPVTSLETDPFGDYAMSPESLEMTPDTDSGVQTPQKLALSLDTGNVYAFTPLRSRKAERSASPDSEESS